MAAVPRQSDSAACALCAGQAFQPFRFGLLRCAGCGLVVDPAVFRPGAAEALNQDAFGDGYETKPSFWSRWFEDWKNRRYLANLRRAGVTRGRLLEVGVGTGAFLRAARHAGFEAEGCDLSASLYRRVQQATGIAVHNVPLEQLPAGTYDVVAMHHVQEHVSDPVGFLRAARERLQAGGILHIAVPNVDCWEALLPGWNSYAPYRMLYFNHRTLARAVATAGDWLSQSWTFEAFSVWFLAILRTVAGVNRADSAVIRRPAEFARSGSGHCPAFVEHLYRLAMLGFGMAVYPLRLVQSTLGRGDELICIARKG